MNQLIEYIKIHIISLEQDIDICIYNNDSDHDIDYLNGAINTCRHLLSVAEGMIRE